jgi:hypothetical protein
MEVKEALEAKDAQQSAAATGGGSRRGRAAEESDEFYALIDALKAARTNKGDCAELLGYAKSHPSDSFKSVVAGKSKRCTLAQAITKLREALEAKIGPAQAIAVLEEVMQKRGWAAESASKPASASDTPVHKPDASAGSEAPTGRVADAHGGSDDRRAMPAEEMLAECKSIFGQHLRRAVEQFQRKDAVPDHYVPPAWPTEDRPTLSEWYRTAERASAYVTTFQTLSADRAARASALAEGIVRAWPRVKGADGKGKVRVWLMDGAGHFFFEVLRVLKESWPTELDSRVEFSLVDWVVAMNTYHADAIPCAKVLAGDIHALIKDCAACALPHCAYFNYSLTTTNGTTKGMYESGAFPGSKYDTRACMAATATSCSKLLGANADTSLMMLSFSAVRGGTRTAEKMGTEDKMREAFGDTLAATEVKSDRADFVTFTVSKKE